MGCPRPARCRRRTTAASGPPQRPGGPARITRSRCHFLQAERLGHVVVAAQGQTGDLVLQVSRAVRNQQQQVRRCRPARSQRRTQTVVPGIITSGITASENDLAPGRAPLGRSFSRVIPRSLEFQADRQFHDVGLVVDDDARASGVCLSAHGRSHSFNVLQFLPIVFRVPAGFL